MDARAVSRSEAVSRAREAGSVSMPEATGRAAEVGARLLACEDVAALRAALEAVQLDDVADAVRLSPEGYARVPLAISDAAEVLLLAWLPGQRTLVHDHGLSIGFVKVLAGEGRDESFALVEERAVLADARAFGEGALLVERPEQVHRIVNDGAGILITLHVYAPSLRGTRVYEES